jgi:uncharacterized membrane protein YvbJ
MIEKDNFCSKCGEKLSKHSKFCSKCGKQIDLPPETEDKKFKPFWSQLNNTQKYQRSLYQPLIWVVLWVIFPGLSSLWILLIVFQIIFIIYYKNKSKNI